MASVASGKASSKAPGNPNPTSAQYAAQRGSIDMLMRTKDSRPPTSTATNLSRGARGGEASAASSVPPPKLSFLEAVRAQRQVRVQELRNAPKTNEPANGILGTASAAAADPSNFHTKGGGGGGFSALATSSSKAPKAKAKAKPQAQSNTAWIAALASPSNVTGTNAAAAAATTAAATTTTGPSFAQVQDELEAGFQKYSRANPLGGVGAARGGGDSEGGQQKQGQSQGQGQNQNQNQGQRSDVPMTATARNLKARQLMVAPQSASRREDERIAAAKKKHYNNGGDESSDEDVGRSALGRKKARNG